MSKIAELALLAKASGLGGRAATDDEAFRRYFGELGLELGELEDVDSWPDAWSPYISPSFSPRRGGPAASASAIPRAYS
jgi:hypothetical protein